MRKKRKDRLIKPVQSITLIFYHSSVDVSTLPKYGNKHLVSNSTDIKNIIKTYESFNSKKDRAMLFLFKDNICNFSEGLPNYIDKQFV